MNPTRNTILATIAFIALTLAIVAGTRHHIATLRANQASIIADAIALGHWHGERGNDITTARAAWAKFESDMR